MPYLTRGFQKGNVVGTKYSKNDRNIGTTDGLATPAVNFVGDLAPGEYNRSSFSSKTKQDTPLTKLSPENYEDQCNSISVSDGRRCPSFHGLPTQDKRPIGGKDNVKDKCCVLTFEKTSQVQSGFISDVLRDIRPKDAGYAWVVVGAMLFSNVLTAGYVKSFGMVYNSIVAEYPGTSGTMAGVMLGMLAGCRSIFAPMAAAFSSRYGIRASICIGTSMCFSGLAISYFCIAVWQLAITLGAMMGTGLCLIESCQVVVTALYFKENLSIANGIRVSGNPLGGMVYPFVIVFLSQEVGVKLTLILMAAIFLHLFICAALIRPQKTHERIQILDSMKKIQKDRKESQSPDDAEIYKEISRALSESSGSTGGRKPLEFHFLRNCVYWIFILVSMSISLALPLVIYYVPIYGRKIGFSPYQNSVLLSLQSLTDILFRIGIGFLSDRKLYKRAHGFIFCLCVGGTGAILIPFFKNFWGTVAATTLFTFGSAGYFAYLSVVLTEQFGPGSIGSTWGFVRMVQGIFNFVNPPLLGAIVDYSESFTVTFVVMGLGMSMAALFLLLEPLVIKVSGSSIVIT